MRKSAIKELYEIGTVILAFQGLIVNKKQESAPGRVRFPGAGNRIRFAFLPQGKNYSVAAVQPAASDSPLDCHI